MDLLQSRVTGSRRYSAGPAPGPQCVEEYLQALPKRQKDRAQPFLPAGVYKYCHQGEHSPIRLGGGILSPTDHQIQAHLLCKGCEDILSGGGETWVGPKLATWERTFPLYNLLTKKPPDQDIEGMRVYFAISNPELNAEKLIHFAIGIFWKASVHSWSGTSNERQIDLGPYSDALRRWLMRESDFPKHAYLRIVVATPAAAQIVLIAPHETPRHGWRHFLFHVPGVLFLLDVGKTVNEGVRPLSICHVPEHPIVVYDAIMQGVANSMAEEARGSRKTNAYLRAMEKIKPPGRK